MNIVNFFIVGAAKSGTSSIYNYLSQHPDIYMSPIKEPHFFSTDIRAENFTQSNYKKNALNLTRYFAERPLKKQHIAFIDNKDQYQSLFDDASGEKILGETSTGYLYSKSAAQNIAEYNPDAKILVILREPVDRAHSHWKMNLSSGNENMSSTFLDAIDKDFNQAQKGWGVSNLYIELGLYYPQLKRYMDNFPEKNIKVLFYEDLSKHPEEFMDSIFEFLDLKAIALNFDEKSNVSARPRSITLFKLLRYLNIRKIIPVKLKKFTKSLLTTNTFTQTTTEEKIKIYNDFFKNDVEKLESLLNANLKGWKYSDEN